MAKPQRITPSENVFPSHKQYVITFSSAGIGDVNVMPDETSATLASGYGGWEVVSRPHKKGLTQWTGKDPLRMTVPILFDGFRTATGQEIPISRLSRMALPAYEGTNPPVVNVDGVTLPSSTGIQDWVIESLAWGTNVIYDFQDNGVMVRMRQDCVVNLLEYVDPDYEAFKSITGLSVVNSSGKVLPRRVTVKAGQTLQQISKNVYGTSKKWQKIATANNIRDPKHLRAGISLRIPPA